MSTIDRVRAPWRSWRTQQRALSVRAVRVRNVLVRRAAARLGLIVPDDADLRALSDRMNLLEALTWWNAQRVAATPEVPLPSRRGRLIVRVACITVLAMLAAALSPAEVH